MVWNTHAAAHSVLRFLRRTRYFFYGDLRERRAPPSRHRHGRLSNYLLRTDLQVAHERTLSTALLFAIMFVVILFRLIYVTLLSEPTTLKRPAGDPVFALLLVTVIVAAIAAVAYFLVRAPVTLARALLWVSRGNHERRIGVVGLGILCIGFLIQAWVNVLP